MAYQLSAKAERDLADLANYGFDNFGEAVAQAYYFGLTKAVEMLAENPRMARLRYELIPPRRAFPWRAHVIIHDIDSSDDIIIIRVLHGRSDWLANQPMH